jgi:hypothetical protein
MDMMTQLVSPAFMLSVQDVHALDQWRLRQSPRLNPSAALARLLELGLMTAANLDHAAPAPMQAGD